LAGHIEKDAAMKVLLRSDASPTQGTGHVMRCLTLGEELEFAGHEVHIATSPSGISWLERLIDETGFTRHDVSASSLDSGIISRVRPDWLVVDSYEIPAHLINLASAQCLVLAIVDGDTRGIDVDLVLDHNLGAEDLDWPPHVAERVIAGSKFALVRRAIREARRHEPWKFTDQPPHVLAVMGGSDPGGLIVEVAHALSNVKLKMTVTLVCAPAWRDRVDAIVSGLPGFTVIDPTNDLPQWLTHTHVVISAAGTSSWEICTLGLPAILLGVVDNQSESLRRMVGRGFVEGIDLHNMSRPGLINDMTSRIEQLILNESRRHELSEACTAEFDGHGAQRVVTKMVTLQRAAETRAEREKL